MEIKRQKGNWLFRVQAKCWAKEKNLGKFFASRKEWKLHPHLALLDYVMKTEHLPCNKESRPCSTKVVPARKQKNRSED
jgi:hypothetical protein